MFRCVGLLGRGALAPRALGLSRGPGVLRGMADSSHLKLEKKAELVERLLAAKARSGKSFDQVAGEIGVTNAYAAQLFLNQAQLRPGRVDLFRSALPEVSDEDVAAMQRCPYRSFDPSVQDEPLVYRLKEAVLHYGEGLKRVVNEKFGDGIMSAIDFYVTVDKAKGLQGEDRVVVTFNGKYLAYNEQTTEGADGGKR